MALPYLPGWWDSIDKNALQNFVGSATRAFAPEASARFDYNQMIRQNPLAISQLANIDPQQRQAIAAAMGFKDYEASPLSKVGIGSELQDRLDVRDFLREATPEQREIRLAGKAGTKTTKDISQANQAWDWETQLKDFQFKKNDFDSQEMEFIGQQRERSFKRLQEAQANNPNVNLALVAKRLTQDPYNVTPDLQQQLTVIYNDPELKDALQTIIEADQFNQNRKLKFAEIFDSRGQRSEAARLQFYSNIGVRAQTRAKTFEEQIRKLQEENPLLTLKPDTAFEKDPTLKNRYNSLLTGYRAALEELDTSNKLIGKIAGVELPSNYGQNQTTGFELPTASGSNPRLDRIRADYQAGKIKAEAIRASKMISEEDKKYILGGK
jgi:hypothetical protein